MSSTQSKGKALITGASTGIGAVYADRLAKRGYDLVLVARNEQKLNEVAAQIQSSTGRNVEILQADLNTSAGVEAVASRLRTDAAITALVNNAGIAAVTKLAESDPAALESMIYLNVTALTHLTLAALPGFLARTNGLVINISSVVALAPEVLNGSYSGTKAYVVNFTQSLANEISDKGIRVQAVLPGATATALWSKAGLPVEHLPSEIVMSVEDMVDASLGGLDQGELITIPSLPDVADFEKYEAARKALGPNLSRNTPAARYNVKK